MLTEWKTYYLAQHYGLRTRLLDWTESFSAALFFALNYYAEANARARHNRKPCVWMLDPTAINFVSVKDRLIISPENNPPVNLWLPHKIKQRTKQTEADGEYIYNNNFPLAIYPRKTNQRIIAQQGVFTIHGLFRDPLEDFVMHRVHAPGDCLARIELDVDHPAAWLEQLGLLGVRKQQVFPDIDTFCGVIRKNYDMT